MSVENSSRDATLAAPNAYVRSFASVVPFVDNQRGALREGFAALIAGILPFPGVDDTVGPQEGLASEALAAHGAAVRFLTGVRSVVDLQTLGSLQLFAAERAEISASLARQRTTMSLDLVLLQQRFVFVHLVANVALVLGPALLGLLDSCIHRSDRRVIMVVIMVQTIVLLQAAHKIHFAVVSFVATRRKRRFFTQETGKQVDSDQKEQGEKKTRRESP